MSAYLECKENDVVGYVQFPMNQKGFSEFVGNLLGEPQHVRGVINGEFIVDINGLEKLDATIMQRINQQNRANLIEFISKIYFDNDTSITINSLDGLKNYRNLEDLGVIRLEVIWNFLIQFEDKKSLEKQTIRLCFDTEHMMRRMHKTYYFVGAGISYEISYSARTWGIDIENLIRKAITSTFIQKNKFKEIFRKIKTSLSIIIPATIYIVIFGINCIFVNTHLSQTVQDITKQISNVEIEQQFSFIAKYIASVPWYKFTTYNNLFLVVMFIVCIVFAVILDDLLDNVLKDNSFIFLADNDQASILKKIKKELGKQKAKYFITLLANISCGVLSNFIFQLILKLFGLD